MINIFPEDAEDSQQDDFQALQMQYDELKAKYQELEGKYTALQQEYDEYKQNKSKAGRKPNDEKWTARYHEFARMKEGGFKREDIMVALSMSRATYFRYNKVYTSGGNATDLHKDLESPEIAKTVAIEIPEVTVLPEEKVEIKPVAESMTEEPVTLVQPEEHPAAPEPSHEGLVLDEETGEYVTPEGLKRRRKLAAIRARRAAEEELKRQQAELEAAKNAANEEENAAEEATEKPSEAAFSEE